MARAVPESALSSSLLAQLRVTGQCRAVRQASPDDQLTRSTIADGAGPKCRAGANPSE